MGSGKSTIASIFKTLCVPVYDSDTEAKKLMESNASIINALREKFGEDIYTTGGTLNRKKLAALIFTNPIHIEWINQCVHPVVLEDIRSWKKRQTSQIVIIESAILIEKMNLEEFDKIIVVTAPEKARIHRIIKRDQMSENDIQKRMIHQLKEVDTLKYADFIIKNDGQSSIIRQTLEVYQKISGLQSE
jgi:dephospho-CoA kinase